jgi:hypothetical protein
LARPLRNSARGGLSVKEVSAPGEGWNGNKQAPGHNWPWRPPVTMETRGLGRPTAVAIKALCLLISSVRREAGP